VNAYEDAFDPANTRRDVYADRGYPSRAREAWLKREGYRSQIQRKGQKNKPLLDCQQRRNHRISKSRTRVEHVFAGIERMGGKMVRTIGQARAHFAMTMMAAWYNMKRLAFFHRMEMVAF
jgi:transposase, IS5 family